eukprot:TRINITY_DN37821_c0_g1_i1.p1 TRINITY_DN37821_c0_g1~~TRINITY_DN37821_c0_g1_i1.p1  ORF type:complete len:662 (+),score=194.86 TRINITY_DN37821_c0_g1_i1:49-1986(+)
MLRVSKSLLINVLVVESPSKARTIQAYLKNISTPKRGQWKVIASRGHVTQLVDIEAKEMKGYFQYMPNVREEILDTIINETFNGKDKIYLATDPDREGELIASDIDHYLRSKGVETAQRVFFNEVTQKAVAAALLKPGKIDSDLVDAGNARRVTDYYFGIGASTKLRSALRANEAKSAGRVQSPALALLVDRQNEIKTFESEQYHSARVSYQLDDYIDKTTGLTWGKTTRLSKEEAEAIKKAFPEDGLVFKCSAEYHEAQAKPPAYFDTVTCLKECCKATKLPIEEVSKVLQKLFEKGHITYIRTDATTISPEAAQEIAKFIKENYGSDFVATDKARTKKVLHAQEAHEAIRPTLINRQLCSSTPPAELLVYDTIRTHTLNASMVQPQYHVQTIKLTGPVIKKKELSISVVRKALLHQGSLALGSRDSKHEKHIKVPKSVNVQFVETVCASTKPPTPYSAADMIDKMKQLGIGRPSTYANISKTLLSRGYVEAHGNYLVPTKLGMSVIEFMRHVFPDWVDYKFTSKLEKQLDKIARGKQKKKTFLMKVKEDFGNAVAESRPKSRLGVHPTLNLWIYKYAATSEDPEDQKRKFKGWRLTMGDVRIIASLSRGVSSATTLEEAVQLINEMDLKDSRYIADGNSVFML